MLEVNSLFQLLYSLLVSKLHGIQVQMHALEDTRLLEVTLRPDIIDEQLVLVREDLFSDEHEIVVDIVQSNELAIELTFGHQLL
jgi:hypothetical protein